tara:strand:+ start:334 stop:540 length:207 start_codon:yes stop_codon:yes gene_type:complete
MQVGDLVRLSSYGNKVKSNSRLIGPNDLGMIVKFNCHDNPDFPYQVDWFYLQGKDKMQHSRQDLKYAR